MPLLISDNDLFEITVRYKEDGMKILYYEDGETLPDDAKIEKFKFKYPNWVEQQTIMANALTVDAAGTPFADPYRYMDNKIKTLLKGWTLKDGEGKDVELNIGNIERLNSSLVNYLNTKMDEILGTSDKTNQ